MIKKLIALAATALVSFNASADYIRYDFGGPMTGHFIQHEDDGSIAYFRFSFPVAGAFSASPDGFNMGLHPAGGEGGTSISSATTYFRNNGPTNFSIYSDFGADQYTNFAIDFSRATQGNFAYTAKYSTSIYFNEGFKSFSGTVTGLLVESNIDPLAEIDFDFLGGYYEYVYPIIPTFINANKVPEPGSMALLAIGAIGAFGATRRRKAAQ